MWSIKSYKYILYFYILEIRTFSILDIILNTQWIYNSSR
jgi:hypothetical protein